MLSQTKFRVLSVKKEGYLRTKYSDYNALPKRVKVSDLLLEPSSRGPFLDISPCVEGAGSRKVPLLNAWPHQLVRTASTATVRDSQADSRSPHRLFVVSHRLTVSMGRKREVPPQYSVFTERAAVLRQRVEEMARNGTAEPAQNRGFAASNSQPEMPMLTQSLDVTAYKQYCHFLLQQLERSKVAFDALREEYCKLRQRTGPPYSDVDALLCQAPETGAIPGLPPMNGVVNLDGTSPRTILANDVADANGLSWLASPKQTPERASVHMPRLPTPPSKDSTSAPLPPFHGLTNVDAPPGLNAALGVSADGVNTTAVPLPTAAQVRDLAAGVLGLHANRQMPSTEASLRPNVSNTSLHSLLSDKSSEELLTCLLNCLPTFLPTF